MFATPYPGMLMSRSTALKVAGFLSLSMIATVACATSNSASGSPPVNSLSAEEQREGWKLIFDGSTTAGWRNYRKQDIGSGWQVVDGALTRAGDNAGDIVTNDKYRDFELALDWRVAEGGNSGIFYRATEEGNSIWESAPEMQVLDDARHSDGKSPLTSAGSNFALYEAPRGISRPAGEWNAARLIVNAKHVEHWLNGKKLLEYEFGSSEWLDRLSKSKFRSMNLYGTATEGHIGLQDHGDRVEFRNIRIKVLP